MQYSDLMKQQLEQAKQFLYRQQFKDSDKITKGIIKEDSSNYDAIYILAVSLRMQGKFTDSIHRLDKVIRITPNHSRAYQEKGHVYFTQNKYEKAIACYEKAVQLNNALLPSWKALTNLYQLVKYRKGFDNALSQVQRLEKLSPELIAVKSYLQEGNIDMADKVCRHYMQNNKQNVEGMRLLAEIALKMEILDDAEFILESALEFEPDYSDARADYISVLIKRQKFGKAHENSCQLFNGNPENIYFKALNAHTFSGIGETETAAKMFEEIVNEQPDQEQTWLALGHTYKTLGEIDKSVNAYQQVYKIRADFGDAFWSLANTKSYKFLNQEIRHMEKYLAKDDMSVADRVHMGFALAKCYEDRSEYEKAFKLYESSNELNKKELKYEAKLIERRVSRQIKYCTKEYFESKANIGYEATDPIFIVGLPRAGSTLLEQILASHSKIDGTMELPNIISLVYRLRGRYKGKNNEEPQYPKILTEIEDSYFERFGKQFIDDTQVYRHGAPFFIDKMPNNFVHIGLIKLILPNAKIIDARRHPMSCCFSGFKQLFGEGQEFTYGLTEIGTYYREYVRLMKHWDEVLPGFVLRIQHEDVIDDLEGQVRRMLDFCDLEFEEACVNYYKTERSIRTPSAEQVRQPIFRSSIEQWRNFEPWLGPLKEALGEEILQHYSI